MDNRELPIGIPRGVDYKIKETERPYTPKIPPTKPIDPIIPALNDLIDRLVPQDEIVAKQSKFFYRGEQYPKSQLALATKLNQIAENLIHNIEDPKNTDKDNRKELLEVLGLFCALYPAYLK